MKIVGLVVVLLVAGCGDSGAGGDGLGGGAGSGGGDSGGGGAAPVEPATHFADAAMDWSVPDAGLDYGFYRVAQDAVGGGRWATMDMDGDGKPDLVVTADQDDKIFGSAANQVWHVYLNTGAGFAATSTDWTLPDAGLDYGFYRVSQDVSGGGRWATIDMDGDDKVDLVMTADQTDATYGAAADQVWHVYFNTGAGFEGAATDWNLPDAGLDYGFYRTSQDVTGGGRWVTMDLSGDGKPELVMTADQDDAIYGSAADQVWHVYGNTGHGFEETATDWKLPDAGLDYGFYRVFQDATSGGRWSVMDMTSDGRPDLVMTADQNDALFGSGADQVWRVYVSDGAGFGEVATDWGLPDAGLDYGFYRVSNDSVGGGRWETMDLDGDRRPDLVLTVDQADAIFGSPASQVWHVFVGE
ncbi:MAG: hypothetical protein U0271_20330 [Polyangiaceae bacterium]